MHVKTCTYRSTHMYVAHAYVVYKLHVHVSFVHVCIMSRRLMVTKYQHFLISLAINSDQTMTELYPTCTYLPGVSIGLDNLSPCLGSVIKPHISSAIFTNTKLGAATIPCVVKKNFGNVPKPRTCSLDTLR